MNDQKQPAAMTNVILETASPKGLVAGLAAIPISSTSADADKTFDTVPDIEIDLMHTTLLHIKWILVAEKEVRQPASYLRKVVLTDQGHVQDPIRERLSQILFPWQWTSCYSESPAHLLHTAPVTHLQGKGYPDLSTRRFLRSCLDCPCWSTTTPPPIFGLFDCDRDGINILQTYRQGSIALAHESASTVPEMKWLGLRLDDVVTGAADDAPLLPLSLVDRERIRAMLARQVNGGDAVQQQCFSELQKMLVLNVKAEIQLLDERPGGLVQWLEEKMWKELALLGL